MLTIAPCILRFIHAYEFSQNSQLPLTLSDTNLGIKHGFTNHLNQSCLYFSD